MELFSGSEVIDLEERSDDKIHLTVKQLLSGSIFSCIADRILLATGHWFEKNEQHGYFPSPWPARHLLEKTSEGEKVAVIETSLSAMEVVLTLTSNGHFIRDNSNELVYVPPRKSKKICALLQKRAVAESQRQDG